ncbi:MAG TPA: hypothetical protein VFZ66_00570 [Herpetosiphonaceae bacterium]
MDRYNHSLHIVDQLRYLVTSLACSLGPVVLIALLPEPWHSSFLPLAALFGAYSFMFVLAILLYALEQLWRLLRRPANAPIACPACHTIDQPYRPFYVARVAPLIVRIHCPECHERWIERR